MKPNVVGAIVKKYAALAALEKPVTTHGLREMHARFHPRESGGGEDDAD